MNRTVGAHKVLGFQGVSAVAVSLMLLLTLGVPHTARADTLLAAQTTFFSGAVSQTLSLSAPQAGTVDVTLTDLAFPDPLQSLSFFASSETTVLPSQQVDPMSWQFAVAGPGAFYAHIMGIAQEYRGFDFGLYGLEITFAPTIQSTVPLPPGILLFASGLMGLGLLAHRLRRRKSMVAAEGLLAR